MKYVPFICTHNAGRSQMAQAFFGRYAPGTFAPSRRAPIRLGRYGPR